MLSNVGRWYGHVAELCIAGAMGLQDAGSRRVSAVVREQPSGLQLAGELESHAQNVETCQSLETSRNGALSALRARGPGRHCRGFARRIN